MAIIVLMWVLMLPPDVLDITQPGEGECYGDLYGTDCWFSV